VYKKPEKIIILNNLLYKMDYSKYLKSLDKTVNYDNIDPLQKDNHNIWLIVRKEGFGQVNIRFKFIKKKRDV
jgi:hypothetical protein